MNYKIILRIVSLILIVEAFFMLPALVICLVDGDFSAAHAFVCSVAIGLAAALLMGGWSRGADKRFYAKEGLVCVGLCWVALSLLGCLPFLISGAIPYFIDALFEIVSGFTTTGASILTNVEALPRGVLYWRSFSHWLGGMGVLVFILALVPLSGDRGNFSMHLLRAESPGPDVGKLVPHIKDTAMILYLLYFCLTVLNVIFLLAGGMSGFDAVCTAFGCAGTGGFGVKNDSITGYSPYLQDVCTVFMMLFGVNFSCYYLLLRRQWRGVLRDEELRFYLCAAFASMAIIYFNIRPMYATFEEAARHSAFQVSSIMTTTGFATTDFGKWPNLSKTILVVLMMIGACGGSTGGGLKCGRVVLLMKSIRRSVRQALYPQKVQSVRMNGQVMDEKLMGNVNAYLTAYVMIVVVSFLLISLEGQTTTTNFTAVMACFNNIGPGLEAVGPTYNYSVFGDLSKGVLILDMLAGRLEIFPILVLFSRHAWSYR